MMFIKYLRNTKDQNEALSIQEVICQLNKIQGTDLATLQI